MVESIHRFKREIDGFVFLFHQFAGRVPIRTGVDCVEPLEHGVDGGVDLRRGVAPGSDHSVGLLEEPFDAVVEGLKVEPMHGLSHGDQVASGL